MNKDVEAECRAVMGILNCCTKHETKTVLINCLSFILAEEVDVVIGVPPRKTEDSTIIEMLDDVYCWLKTGIERHRENMEK